MHRVAATWLIFVLRSSLSCVPNKVAVSACPVGQFKWALELRPPYCSCVACSSALCHCRQKCLWGTEYFRENLNYLRKKMKAFLKKWLQHVLIRLHYNVISPWLPRLGRSFKILKRKRTHYCSFCCDLVLQIKCNWTELKFIHKKRADILKIGKRHLRLLESSVIQSPQRFFWEHGQYVCMELKANDLHLLH